MKLIATDLDGTLLNDLHEISKENIEAIQLAKENGVEVIVATGRSYNAAKKPLESAGLSCPIICLNGAKVHNKAGEVLSTAPLDKGICKVIQQACEAQGIYFEVFTNQGGFSKSRDQFIEVMVDINKSAFPNLDTDALRKRATDRFQEEEMIMTDDFETLFNRSDIEIYKVLAFSLEQKNLDKVANQLQGEQTLTITSSGHSNLEFNDVNAQKGLALQTYAEQINVDLEEIMAIGDNYNDLSMLKMAGRGVAMGNADDDIKKACTHTTKSNLENGVGFAIKEMLAEQ
ncbi:Cof-type HAD-IIB family hydrolase [Gracilibacillus salinarum]|uniref:Cof-type HAD-IIB family hydrolase n=1 Tax=Gracilibacillus salinarum TaxID=2932255 RepID=A0ABY4GQ79_9BACI|nr:Cof-type HAD-IIB family hydrolase [Gracilibacillus salinarum]UOQ86439.1 Cof-type HAD-IIB family hydrolase [Gracilibacillus salinarum]